jgi:hypothetical protein
MDAQWQEKGICALHRLETPLVTVLMPSSPKRTTVFENEDGCSLSNFIATNASDIPAATPI